MIVNQDAGPRGSSETGALGNAALMQRHRERDFPLARAGSILAGGLKHAGQLGKGRSAEERGAAVLPDLALAGSRQSAD